jgi:hypothetical protein
VNESTNKRVLWFAAAEVLVLVLMSAWQIANLRSFFERKGRL